MLYIYIQDLLYFIKFAQGNQNFIDKSKYLEYYLITILLKTFSKA